jgi:photosystem II stability/assembly factor-like uncharacterized protein
MQNTPSRLFFLRERHLGILVLIVLTFYLLPGVLCAQQKLYDDLFAVSFADESYGWVCGRWGTILHTSDGGASWAVQDSGTDYSLSSISFADRQNGWAVGDEGTIVHTADGGKTWKKQESPEPFFLMDVCFVTPLMGWIVTERTHVLVTDDGGKNWRIQFSDQDFILKAVSFADALHGWAVGEYGYIYYTDDGGATWQHEAGFFDISDLTGEVVGGTYLFDVVAVDPQKAWAVGIDSRVVKTEDGGKTWQEVPIDIPKAHLYCVTSDRVGTILIGGNGAFISSTDHGETWNVPEFKPPITYGWLYGLAPRGSSGFAAVGWEGTVYLDTAGAWQRVEY